MNINLYVLRILMGAGFSSTEVINFVKQWTDPILTVLQWAVPIACVIFGIKETIEYIALDDQEKEQRPLKKKLLNLTIAGVLGVSIPQLFKIFLG